MPVVWNSAIQAYVDTDSNAVRVGEYWVNSQGSVYDSNTGQITRVEQLPLTVQGLVASGQHSAQRIQLPAPYVSPTTLPTSGTDITRQAAPPVAVTQPAPAPTPTPTPTPTAAPVRTVQPAPTVTRPPWEVAGETVDLNARAVYVNGIGYVNPKAWVWLQVPRGAFQAGQVVPVYKLPPEDHAALNAAADRAKTYWPEWADANPNSEDGRKAPVVPGTPAPGAPVATPPPVGENRFLTGITNFAQLNELIGNGETPAVAERLITNYEGQAGARFNNPYRNFMKGMGDDIAQIRTLQTVGAPTEDRNITKFIGDYYDAGMDGLTDTETKTKDYLNSAYTALQGTNLDENQRAFQGDDNAQMFAVRAALGQSVAPTLRRSLQSMLTSEYDKYRTQGANGPSNFLAYAKSLGLF